MGDTILPDEGYGGIADVCDTIRSRPHLGKGAARIVAVAYQDVVKGDTILSPTVKDLTSGPVATISPVNS